jgi:hypothetical protein
LICQKIQGQTQNIASDNPELLKKLKAKLLEINRSVMAGRNGLALTVILLMTQKDEPDLNPRQISRDAPLDFVKNFLPKELYF